MRRILVTGGAGFVGHHVVEHFVKNTDDRITVLDRLTYASSWDRLRDIECFNAERVTCIAGSFSEPVEGGLLDEIGPQDVILHLGAETHVDNSITDPLRFIQSNVIGTHHALKLAERLGARFVFFSTDEVFGPAPGSLAYREDDRHRPGNPYAATKSSGESLTRAYGNTYGVDYIITRCMNIFGERQHSEKFIPLVIRSVLNGQEVTIHADPTRTVAGSRFYIHARNVASALQHLLQLDKQETNGEDYHIVGEREVDNLTLSRMISEIVGKPLRYRLVDFHSSRPGHDLRYGLDGSKLAAAGWTPPRTFEESLERTVQWTLNNRRWIE